MDKIRIKEQDLVLNVGNNVNTQLWNESKFDNFIITLTNGRKFQEDAILTALRFMCGGQYANISKLAEENYNINLHLKERFATLDIFKKALFFNDSYTANIDLATGTGKSWVLYGLATIMLSAGFVDQVLVLVPSITIERELMDKFKRFASDTTLNATLAHIPPKIINGTESIVKGCICIENRDAIYKNSRSSVVDSLLFKGERTFILNDEAHHIYYSEQNEWKKFIELIKPRYNIGVSGTCYYKDNDYFTDVIYRYSLRQAIEDGWVKNVNYIIKENMPAKDDEKWQIIIKSHNDIKSNLVRCGGIIPVSIFVTDKTDTCDNVAKKFKNYLKITNNLTDDEVNEKVIVIHSKPNVAGDRLKLKDVDKPTSKVEWIFSVSMLTEGWDAKRVFQIIPHEERAFNSKLLIAQVMGRGLRIPNNWLAQWSKPEVIIFNHEKWATNVRKLVDEILEIERRISTKVIEDSIYNFELLNVGYKKTETASVRKKGKKGLYNLFTDGYIKLPTDMKEESVEIELSNLNNTSRTWSEKVEHKTISVDDMAEKMWSRFNDIPDDDNQNLAEQYQTKYTIEKLKAIINKSLQESGNSVITNKLEQRFMASMSTAWRQEQTYITYKIKPNDYHSVNTKEMRSESTNASSLKNNHTLFWTDGTSSYLTDEEKEFFNEIKDTGNGYKQIKINNKNNLKSPVSLAFSISEPEKKFINKLLENENILTAWVKSPSKSFYFFEFAWKKNPRHGEAIRYDHFNPDFFIKVNDRIIVVEIKGDEEIANPQPENIGKHKAGIEHFDILNKHLRKQVYKFTMLTPKNYDAFFESIKNNGNIYKFNIELDT
jgi:type III restriction enzyme